MWICSGFPCFESWFLNVRKTNRLFLVQKTSEKLSWHPNMSHPKRKCRFFKHQNFKCELPTLVSVLCVGMSMGPISNELSCHQELRGWKSACRENRWSCLSSMVAPLSDRWWIVNAELWVTGTAPNQPHRKKMAETAGSRWKSGVMMNNLKFVCWWILDVVLFCMKSDAR